MKNLFSKAEPLNLAQFFVYGDPDFKMCGRYYQVSDRDALASLNPLKAAGGPVECTEDTDQESEGRDETVYLGVADKTPLKMLIRETVWLLGRWRSRRLWRWIEAFRPERVCLFLANNTFLIRLAIQIVRKYRIPLVVYSTEGYCFMDYNYFTNRPSVVYRLYYAWLCSAYRKVSAYVTEGFFNSTLLRDRYAESFGYPCKCIMNGSETPFLDRSALEKDKAPLVSYLGNLGLGRSKALMEVAQALQEIDAGLFLDIYGAAPDDGVKEELTNCPGIRFHGFVSYEEVIRIIHESSLLVHAEWNDPIVNRDLKYAFSTKIGDSVCSGTPFLIYADAGLAETVFLKESGCAFVVSERESLKSVLRQALTDENERRRIVENAKKAIETSLTGNGEFMEAFQ